MEYHKDLCTNDTSEPEPNNLTIMFVDDVIQIITTDNAIRTRLYNRTLILRTQRKVEKQNQYEREWKIIININKFAVIPVSRRKTHEL